MVRASITRDRGAISAHSFLPVLPLIMRQAHKLSIVNTNCSKHKAQTKHRTQNTEAQIRQPRGRSSSWEVGGATSAFGCRFCVLRYTGFMSLRDITIDRLHHAYFLEGERKQMIAEILGLLEALRIPTRGNPDFHLHELDQFLLEHAHLLREKQQFHSVGGGRKIFLVAFNTILHEAQNALLKTLEEPTEGTHFFFTARSQEVLLPTVRSRMNIIQLPVASQQSVEKNSGEKFLSASL